MRFLSLIVLLSFALIAGACGKGAQTLKSACVEMPGYCSACQIQADCAVTSNLCHESAICSHRDQPFATTQEYCSDGYDPPEQDCTCVDGTCRAN